MAKAKEAISMSSVEIVANKMKKQIASCNGKLYSLQKQQNALQEELSRLHQDKVDRDGYLLVHQQNVASATKKHQDESEYARACQGEIEEHKALMAVQDALQLLSLAQFSLDEYRAGYEEKEAAYQNRVLAINAELAAIVSEIETLHNTIAESNRVSARAMSELGQHILDAEMAEIAKCDDAVSRFQQLLLEAQLSRESALSHARAELKQWPEHVQAVNEMAVKDDANIRAMRASLALMNILIEDGRQIDRVLPSYGLTIMSNYSTWLALLAVDADVLYSYETLRGEQKMLRERRARLKMFLERYLSVKQ